jgi:hypothetical protein
MAKQAALNAFIAHLNGRGIKPHSLSKKPMREALIGRVRGRRGVVEMINQTFKYEVIK